LRRTLSCTSSAEKDRMSGYKRESLCVCEMPKCP
jgi:hypothetical protein